MAELIIWTLSTIGGLVITVLALVQSIRDWRAVKRSADLMVRELVREDLGREVLIGAGQALSLIVAALAVIPEPRPQFVDELIGWSLTPLPAILGALSYHSRQARVRAEERIREARGE